VEPVKGASFSETISLSDGISDETVSFADVE
jgi:hypothetical protein